MSRLFSRDGVDQDGLDEFDRRLLGYSNHQAQAFHNSSPEQGILQLWPAYHINLPHAPPIAHGIQLISPRQALPDKFRAIFPYELFNAVQSKCFDSIYLSNDNVVVSAPTGSGKTAILELAICKLLAGRANENFKIVYQAPIKALCSERARDWSEKFRHMDARVAELTGDTSQAEMRLVGNATIIVTTPEKWDSITRKWRDHHRLIQLVKLFLIDEVHILKDARGATLETVVSRMKTTGANVRFVALSATVPNSDDIAKWLGRDHQNPKLPARRETFDESLRPVKLQKFVYGYECNGNPYVFDKFLDQKLPMLLTKHSHQKPILVFCFTRKSCESTANLLAEYWASLANHSKPWKAPTQRVPVVHPDLQAIVRCGVAFHHAGLDMQDRASLEQHYLKGDVSVICCTSTLAVGINLPCHTVVLKGTTTFANDQLQEYSDLEVMQMLGRAGRPQFDSSAVGIILTHSAHKKRYEEMVSGRQVLESTLHLSLIEHLNSEVSLKTIKDLDTAKKWLEGTFLNIRLSRNPDHYKLSGSINTLQADNRLEQICERDIKILQEAELITNGDQFNATDYGMAMSNFMIQFDSMKKVLELPRAVQMEELVRGLAETKEFAEFRLKPTERVLFRELNKSPLILYPIKEETVTSTAHKVALMIQCDLGKVAYQNEDKGVKLRRQLELETNVIRERLRRLIRAVIECKGADGDSIGMKTALELLRAVSARAWDGKTQVTQVPYIGPVLGRKLNDHGVCTVLELADKQPEDIERFCSKNPPFGKRILGHLEKFPRLAFDLVVDKHHINRGLADEQPPRDPVTLHVRAVLRYTNQQPPVWGGVSPTVTFLAESTTGRLLFFSRMSMRKVDRETGLELRFTVGLQKPTEQLVCHFSCEEIVGTIVSKILKHKFSEALFPRRQAGALVNSPAKAISAGTDATNATPQATMGRRATQENFLIDDDGWDDADLLRVADEAQLDHQAREVESDQGFPDVNDLARLEQQALAAVKAASMSRPVDIDTEPDDGEPDAAEPVRLSNGRWRCNHSCAGGQLLKSGKPCQHACCRDGLEKPRKRPAAKAKKTKDLEGVASAAGNESGSGAVAERPIKSADDDRADKALAGTEKKRPRPHEEQHKKPHEPSTKKAKIDFNQTFDLDEDGLIVVDMTGEAGSGRLAELSLPPLITTMSLAKGLKPSDKVRESNHEAARVEDAGGQSQSHRAHGPEIGPENTAALQVSYDQVLANSKTSPDTSKAPSDLPSQPFSYFDEICTDASTLDCASPLDFLSPPRRTSPFRSGASDDALFQGISDKLAVHSSPENSEAMEGAGPASWPDDGLDKAFSSASPVSKTVSLSDFHLHVTTSGIDDTALANMTAGTAHAVISTPVMSAGETVSSANSPRPLTGEDSRGCAVPGLLETVNNLASGEQQTLDTTKKEKTPKREDEPAWVAEFDPEVVDMFRGLVTFV